MTSRRTALLAALVLLLFLGAYFGVRLFDKSAPEESAPAAKAPPSQVAAPAARVDAPPAAPAPAIAKDPPAPTNPPSRGRVRGRVVDPAAVPIAGASVYVISSHESALGAEEADAAPTTGKSGTFAFDVSSDRVADVGVSKAGFAPILLRDVALSGSAEIDLGDIVLGAGADVGGRVTDSTGEPVPGVAVSAVPGEEGALWSTRTKGALLLPGRRLIALHPADAITDAEGNYVVRGLVAGATYRVAPVGETAGALTVTAPAAGIDFVLAATGVIIVTSLDAETGERLGGASVSLRGPSNGGRRLPDGMTDAARFDDGILLGEYEVESSVRGYAKATTRAVLESAVTPLEVVLRLEKTGGDDYGSIRVVARDDLGRPLEWMCLAVRGEDGEIAESNVRGAEDRKSGVREIARLKPGRYEVTVTSQSRDFGSARSSAEIVAGEVAALEVTVARAGRLSVDVHDESGEGVKGYSIDVLDASGARLDAEISVSSGILSTMGYTPGDVVQYPGRLRVARLPPGECVLVFGGDGFAEERVTATVRAGEEERVAARLRRIE